MQPLHEAYRSTTTAFTTAQGKMVDWVTVVSKPMELLLLTSSGRAAILKEWLERYIIMEDVQCRILQCHHTIVEGSQVDPQPVLEREGILWIRSLDVYPNRVEAISSIPLAIADTQQDDSYFELQRLQAGVPSARYEYVEEINPLELRLAKYAISWKKGCYIGQEVISRLDSYNKLARILTGFESDSQLSAADAKILQEGKVIGRVTSSTNLEEGAIGLAIVKRELADCGEVLIVTATSTIPAKLVSRPFWQ
jgi:folate-binding protein YgfZ